MPRQSSGLRVLTYTLAFSGHSVASLEAQFFDEFLELAKAVGELVVVTPKADVVAPVRNLRILKVPVLRRRRLEAITLITSHVLATLAQMDADVLYVRTLSPHDFVASWVATRLGKPLVYRFPGTWVFEPATPKNTFFRWFFTQVAYSARLLLLYSARMLPEIRRYVPHLDEQRVRVVPNAVDIQRFRPARQSPHSRFDLPSDRKFVLYVGRITWKKGIGEILQAANLVVRANPTAHFVIAGDGGAQHMAVRHQAHGWLAAHGLADKVTFLGPIPNAEIPALINACEFGVYPTHGGEGQTRFLLECLACGVPVIATPVAGNPDVVLDGKTGYLVPVGDYEMLAQRIITMLADDGLRTRLGLTGRKLVEERHDWKLTVPALASILHEAAGR